VRKYGCWQPINYMNNSGDTFCPKVYREMRLKTNSSSRLKDMSIQPHHFVEVYKRKNVGN